MQLAIWRLVPTPPQALKKVAICNPKSAVCLNPAWRNGQGWLEPDSKAVLRLQYSYAKWQAS